MSVVIRLARAGTKKRPVYHVVVADSRFPRDGRFIERLGHFNPLLPKDNESRLKLDMDKVKAWLAKGAQQSDSVTRFMDAAGIVTHSARSNPEKAVPRKERKARAEAAFFFSSRRRHTRSLRDRVQTCALPISAVRRRRPVRPPLARGRQRGDAAPAHHA